MIDTAKAILERGDDRADVPRGHADPAGLARHAQARRRPARARDRRAGRAGRDDRHRGRPQGLADPAAQGPDPGRPRAALPARRAGLAGAGRRGHRPHLAVRDAPVGVARRAAADPPRRDRRRRHAGARAWRVSLARAGFEVDLGCRTAEQAAALAQARDQRPLSARRRAARRDPDQARRRARARAATTSSASRCRRARCPRCSPPTASDPAQLGGAGAVEGAGAAARHAARRRSLSERCAAPARSRCWAAPRTPATCSSTARSVVLASLDRALRRQLARRCCGAAGLDVTDQHRRDRRRAGRLREERRRARRRRRRRPPARTSPAPPPARCSPRSTRSRARSGGRPETFAGLAGAGDLVATVVATGSRTGAPASCWPRECRRARSDSRSASAEAVDACRCLPASPATLPGDAGAGRPGGAGRGTDRAGAAGRLRCQPSRRGASTIAARPCRVGERYAPMPCPDELTQSKAELDARFTRAVPRASARRLLLQLLPRRQPPRRRGPHRADVPAGLSPLRARAARVQRPAAAPVAHPDRPQPRGELLPRPLAQARVGDRGRGHDLGSAHDRVAGRGPRGAASRSSTASSSCPTIAARR